MEYRRESSLQTQSITMNQRADGRGRSKQEDSEVRTMARLGRPRRGAAATTACSAPAGSSAAAARARTGTPRPTLHETTAQIRVTFDDRMEQDWVGLLRDRANAMRTRVGGDDEGPQLERLAHKERPRSGRVRALRKGPGAALAAEGEHHVARAVPHLLKGSEQQRKSSAIQLQQIARRSVERIPAGWRCPAGS